MHSRALPPTLRNLNVAGVGAPLTLVSSEFLIPELLVSLKFECIYKVRTREPASVLPVTELQSRHQLVESSYFLRFVESLLLVLTYSARIEVQYIDLNTYIIGDMSASE